MAVREALLALLADGPRHGYELKTEFEPVTGHVWLLNVGQVYTTLDRLERDGLVRPLSEAVGDPAAVTATAVTATAKRAYEITHAGREELSRWYSEADADEPPHRLRCGIQTGDEVGIPKPMPTNHPPRRGTTQSSARIGPKCGGGLGRGH